MSNPWFRMYKEFATDPVIQSLAFEDQRHYVVILCLKCDGVIDRKITSTARDRIIIRALGLDAVSADEAKRRLIEVGLINKTWQPKGWQKRQFISDNSTPRAKRSRASQKASQAANQSNPLKDNETGNGQQVLPQRDCNGPETEADTDTETDTTTVPDGTGENSVSTKAVPFQKIVDKWNALAERIDLPQTVKITTALKGQIRQRWKDLPSLTNWDNFFDYIENNDFLAGRKPPSPGRDKPFRSTLTWVTKESNFAKIAAKEYE